MKRALKIISGLIAVILLFVGGAIASLVLSAPTTSVPVGVLQIEAPDPEGKPISVTLFYPTSDKPRLIWAGTSFLRVAPKGVIAAGQHPLVVISHGTGGAPTSHVNTALALAEAGYVVAAPIHNGDNFQNESTVGTTEWIVDRARELARVNDFLLIEWKDRTSLDPQRIGVFGFSAGGTTALVTLGGTPDFARISSHCATDPEFVCQLMRQDLRTPAASEWVHDPRVKAAIVVAPGLAFTFEPSGLSSVRSHVQLWQGNADTFVPPTNADIVRRLLPGSPEFYLVDSAGHTSFLPPCNMVTAALLPKRLCVDPPGFDRRAFHKEFNASVVSFFNRNLSAGVQQSGAPAQNVTRDTSSTTDEPRDGAVGTASARPPIQLHHQGV